jgi:hypothetical protein
MVGHKHLPNSIARFFLYKTFRTVSAFRHSRTLRSPTLNSLPASRFPFSFANSTTSSLNLAVYDFLRELPVLSPSVGNWDANFLNWLQEKDATHPSYLSGPMDTQKNKVQFSS